MSPPFKPAVVQTDEVFYFDHEFTSKTPKGILKCFNSWIAFSGINFADCIITLKFFLKKHKIRCWF